MNEPSDPSIDRRPLATREVRVVQRFASWLTGTGVSPNAISTSSMLFGAGAGACLAATSFTEGWAWRGAWLAAAALIQLRLLANMFDGMVAVESGKSSAVGELFNEAPDRVSDVAILVGAGYAFGATPVLGFTAALLAVGVAYLRALGATAGAGQVFLGPMAKPHRMFLLTLVALYSGVAPRAWQPVHASTEWSILGFALVVLIVGCVATSIRRLSRIVHILREAS